ncbi:MAG: aldo/keto reductase [Microbacteriaceae bacterium]|nr:aldo/keto reductase [Microbacteriaceae bacterium]
MPTSLSLNSGTSIPQLGIGVFLVSDVDECQRSVEAALAAGYRLVDTAVAYGNERAVGRGIAASGVPREDVFVTTKVWIADYGFEKTSASIDASIERLGTGYLDLVLLHQPFSDVSGAWRAMEQAQADGRVRSIGVSNFTVADLTDLLEYATVPPAVNQVELNPYYQQRELIPYLRQHEIAAEAWYPLGHGSKRLLEEPVLVELARTHGKSVAQVILRWHVQSGFVAIPKSVDPAHIAENFHVFDFELADDEMERIAALDTDRSSFGMPRWLQRTLFGLIRPRQLR